MARTISKESLKALLRKALNHDRRAIAQLMTVAENDPYARIEILAELYNRTGKAYVIGITGPPGSGKSTLITELVKLYRQKGYSVGVVAVDPSSEMTGGALLGDRIRMADLASDHGVFIRSMATRGQVGGIARATEDVVRILDASGMDYIFVETVGAGQSDVDIKRLDHTTVVVTAPGLGDEIQALKAGIMEIADIFVVNKSDREGADQSAQEIGSMITTSETAKGWRPRLLKTTALSGQGISTLLAAIDQHANCTRGSAEPRIENLRIRQEIIVAAKRYFDEITMKELASTKEFARLTLQVEKHALDPYTAARRIVEGRHRQR